MTITNNCYIFYEGRGGGGVLMALNSTLLVLLLVIYHYKLSNKKVSFSGPKIYVQAQAFNSLMESLSSGVGRFCHMIKLIKYHVTKRPSRSPGAHIQRLI